MATLVLPLAASAIATSMGVTAGTLLMTAITTGAMLAGSYIDQKLFAGKPVKTEGPRLDSVQIMDATEGTPVHRAYGFNRIAGTVIWAARLREEISTDEVGGKGGGGSSQEVTTYKYFASFAVGICEGPIIDIGRVWADGKLLDLSGVNFRIYTGTETQMPDPKIVAVEGADFAPPFRGIAYIVFEELFLEKFGNRIPQLNFEVFSFTDPQPNDLEHLIKAVDIIPGSGEFVYGTTPVKKDEQSESDDPGWGGVNPVDDDDPDQYENKHNSTGDTDFVRSIATLKRTAPNISAAALVVSWFGSDLRVGNCLIEPKVELSDKETEPYNWEVSGIDREGGVHGPAAVVSQDANGRANFGGTPSDRAVFEAIQHLSGQGIAVTFYPFVMMDIPPGNTKPNPYSDNAAVIGQPAFPWRGRITISPAIGFVGSPDKTATATTQITSFMGTATPGQFGSWDGNSIDFNGTVGERSYRRMVLHYAKLCAAAGGVERFIIGTEFVQLTSARSSASTFPFIDALKTLAADVKSILPGAKVSYAANWDEYHSYRPTDGSGDVYFHLDALWSDANIDFVGIDNYLPISDWRDTPNHLDAQLYDSIYDLEYLKSNIEGGEYYDFFYLNDTNRELQVRTPITEFTFGNKRIREWWLNQHFHRPGGVVSGVPTSWVPQSKEIVFTEMGCPAIDKGTNQPNVFFDPKSAESQLPYFSTGGRDDFITRQYLKAWHEYWLPSAGNNPISVVYGGRMINPDRMYVWTWDARPFPEFPALKEVWSDGAQWKLGHWLNGRLGQGELQGLVRQLTKDLPVTIDVTGLRGVFAGYDIDRVMSAREALDGLALFFQFDAFESEGVIRFRHRGGKTDYTITSTDELVLGQQGGEKGVNETYKLTRLQDTDLPREINLKYVNFDFNYEIGSVRARRLIGNSNRTSEASIALSSTREAAQNVAEIMLIDTWVQREMMEAALGPHFLKTDPTDIVKITVGNKIIEFRVESVGLEYARPVKLIRTDRGIYRKISTPGQDPVLVLPPQPVAGLIDFLDIAPLSDTEQGHAPHVALWANPFSAFTILRSGSGTGAGFQFDSVFLNRSVIGKILGAVGPGPEDIIDLGTKVTVQLFDSSVLQSRPLEELEGLVNMCAMKANNGEWECFQFLTATFIGSNTYELTNLLRARRGSESAMLSGIPNNAEFVVLSSVQQTTMPLALVGGPVDWKFGPSSRPVDDPDTWRTVIYTPTNLGSRPFSPVQLEATRDTVTDDITLEWIRRTRIFTGEESWDASEVPLGEDAELYSVDIYNAAGNAIVRTIDVGSPTTIYTSAQQTTDRGAPIGSGGTLKFDVYQVSPTYGRGSGRQKIVTFP